MTALTYSVLDSRVHKVSKLLILITDDIADMKVEVRKFREVNNWTHPCVTMDEDFSSRE